MKVDHLLILIAISFLVICTIMGGAATQIADLPLREYLLSTITIMFVVGITFVVLTELVVFIKKMLAQNT